MLFVFVMQSFNNVIIVSDYYLNTSKYIAQCVNKADISMHCNGKCQMEKKIRQEDKKRGNAPENKIDSFNNFYCLGQHAFTLSPATFDLDKKDFPLLPEPKTIDRPHSIFKPPIV